MKKRTLILLSVVFCMLLTVITPLKVSAAGEDIDNAGQVTETDPETIPETIPETVPETVPETIPETVPETILEPAAPVDESVTQTGTTESSVPMLQADAPSDEPKIVLDETTVIIYRGNQYVVNYSFENTEEKPTVTLTSNDTSIATITDNVVIFGKSAGTTTVLLTFVLNDKEYTEEINVKVLPNAQTAKIVVSKKDDNGNFLAGATLQILDKDNDNKVVKEWVSELEAYEFELPAGHYILHEAEAPIGYEIAEDQEFDVEIKIEDLDAGVEFDISICSHYKGMPSYYVEIPVTGEDGTTEIIKEEVFCINQEWEVPDENSNYEGTILTPSTIRNYTQQTVFTGIGATDKEKKDISDNTLNNQQLYDKILDIIYHKDKAVKAMIDQFNYSYTDSELRFVTETALKNYTNAGITDRKLNVSIANLTAEEKEALINELQRLNVPYELSSDGNSISYVSHRYRDFLYVPGTTTGQSIVKEELGNGNSFGQIIAGHWDARHSGATNQTVKDRVEKYYQLFLYLIRDEDHHPTDMNLYVYSTDQSISGNDDHRYQNLLGVTGYYEEYEQETIEKEVVNKPKTVDVTVKKVWDDGGEDEDIEHLEEITVTLLANSKESGTIVLSQENEWKGSFNNLPMYDGEELITYEVREENVPEGYVASYEEDGEYGFIIHNVKGQGDNEPPPDNPQTGDNIVLYLITLLISIIGFVSSKRYLQKDN